MTFCWYAMGCVADTWNRVMKPRLKRINPSGLSILVAHAEVGDCIEVFPLIKRKGVPASFYAVVTNTHKNHFGRISYHVSPDPRGGQQVMTEELTPLHHRGVKIGK
jgi:hypothetical protein